MFAKNRQLVLTGVFFLDATLLYASWIASYSLRFYVLPLEAPLGVPRFSAYLWYGAVVVLAALLVLRSLRLYRSQRTARLGAEIVAIAQGMTIVTALAALGSFFLRGELARSVLILFWFVGTLALWSERLLIRLALRALRRQGRRADFARDRDHADAIPPLVPVGNEFRGGPARLQSLPISRHAADV